MFENTLTTGQTSGVTRIPAKTLQRYVHDYREFFSDTAQKRTKGRRFTERDINNLLLIRRLYFERVSSDRITAALHGEWEPPAKPVYNALDAVNLVETALQEKQKSQDYSKKAAHYAEQVQYTVNGVEHTLRRFRDVIAEREYYREQVPNLILRIQELEKRLEKLEQKAPQKKGLFW